MQALAPFLAFMLLLLGGCADTTPPAAYQGPQYPESARVEVLFQPGQIAPSCRVFAELLAFYPADVSAQTIAAVLTGEARVRGAQILLIGQSREAAEDEDEPHFLYLGPAREYAMDRGWSNWSSGYSVWKKQGDWLNLGHSEWGREDVLYQRPLAVQAAMLRCN